MNKVFFALVVVLALFTSCSDNGKKVESSKAKEVKETVHNVDSNNQYDKIVSGSYLAWNASHFGGVNKRFGKVLFESATAEVVDGKLTNADILIDMNSLTVESFPSGAPEKAKLTGHLKSKDFFNVRKYPTSRFTMTNIDKGEGNYNSKVTGNLKIQNTTKSISFNANVEVNENSITIKSENFAINRADWGLKYNMEGTPGVPVDYLISNDVGFKIELKLKK